MKIIPWQRGEKQDLTPAEIEELIRQRVTDPALLKYQEAVRQGMAKQVSEWIKGYAEEYRRPTVTTEPTGARIADALDAVSIAVGTSELPCTLVLLTDSHGKEPR